VGRDDAEFDGAIGEKHRFSGREYRQDLGVPNWQVLCTSRSGGERNLFAFMQRARPGGDLGEPELRARQVGEDRHGLACIFGSGTNSRNSTRVILM
jgi:hypothetical protein